MCRHRSGVLPAYTMLPPTQALLGAGAPSPRFLVWPHLRSPGSRGPPITTMDGTRSAYSGGQCCWSRDIEFFAQDLGGTSGWDAGVWGEVSTRDPLLDLPFPGFHPGLRESSWGSRDQISCPQAWVKASLPLNCYLGPYKDSSLSAKKIDLFEKLPLQPG